MAGSSGELIQVVARVRPEDTPSTSVLEIQDHATLSITAQTEKDAKPSHRPNGHKGMKVFTLDRVFGPNSSQEEIYAVAKPLILSTLDGYNGTIFAFGHTGSGKTFTMTGPAENPGIVPRSITDIFSRIRSTAELHPETIFLVRMTYIELYNKQFRNLLPPSEDGGSGTSEWEHVGGAQGDRIEVRENAVAGVYLSGSNLRHTVTSAKDVEDLVNTGNVYRATSSTNCNETSSRSHAILTLYIESRRDAEGATGGSEVRVSKLHLVDLAGSERVHDSGVEGSQLKETQHINLSLSTLGIVLSTLSQNATKSGQAMPVPYRNSKLTHLLKDSLGGNSKTLMITTLRETKEYCQQNLMALEYASRAKRIRNHTVVNRDINGDSGLSHVSAEVQILKSRLLQRTTDFERLRQEYQSGAHENKILRSRLEELDRANDREKKQLEEKLAQLIHNQAGEMATQRRQVTELQQRLQHDLVAWQSRCAEQRQEIKSLKGMVSALEKVREKKGATQEEVADMQNVLQAWQHQAIAAQQELVQVSNKLKQSLALRAKDREQIDALMQKVSSLEEEKESTTHQSRAEVEDVHRSLREVLDERNHLSESLRREVDARAQAEARLLAMQTEKLRVEREATERRSEFEAAQNGLRSMETVNEDLSSTLKSVVQERDSMKTKLQQFQRMLVAMQDETEAVVKSKDAQIDELYSRCEGLAKQVGTLEDDRKGLREESARLEQALSAHHTTLQRVEQLERTAGKAQEESQHAREMVSTAISAIKADDVVGADQLEEHIRGHLTTEISSLLSLVFEAHKKSETHQTDITRQLQVACDTIVELKSQLQDKSTQEFELKSELEALRHTSDAAESAVQELAQSKDELHTKEAALQRQVEALRAQIQSLVDAERSTAKVLEEQRKAGVERDLKAKEAVHALTLEKESLLQEHQSIRTQLEHAQHQLQEQTATTEEQSRALRSQLDNATSELEIIRPQLTEVTDAHKRAQQKATDAEKRVRTLQSELDSARQTITKLEGIRSDFEKLTHQHELSRREVAEANERARGMESQLDSTAQSVQELHLLSSEFDALKKKHELSEQQVAILQEQLDRASNANTASKGRIESLTVEKTQLESDLKEVQASALQTTASLEAQAESLSAQLTTSQSECRVLASTVESLTTKREEDATALEDLQRVVRESTQSSERLQSKLAELTQHKLNLESALKDSEGELEKLRRYGDHLEAENRTLSTAQDEQTERIAQLEATLSETQAVADSSRQELAESNDKVGLLEESLSRSEGALAAHSAELEIATKQIAVLEATLRQAQTDLHQSEKEMGEELLKLSLSYESLVSKLCGKVEGLSGEVDSLRDDQERGVSMLQTLGAPQAVQPDGSMDQSLAEAAVVARGRIEQRMGELSLEATESMSYRSQLEGTKRQCSETLQRVEDISNTLQSVQKEKARVEQVLEDTEARLMEAQRELMEVRERGRGDLDALQQRLDLTKAEVSSVRSQLEASQAQINQSNDDTQAKAQEIHNLRSQISTLQGCESSMRQEIESLQSRLEESGVSLQSVSRELKETQSQVDSLQAALQRSEEVSAALQAQVRSEDSKYQSIAKSYENLLSEKTKLEEQLEEHSARLGRERNDLQTSLSAKESQVTQLQADLHSAETQHEKTVEDLASLQAQVSELEVSKTELAQLLADREQELERIRAEVGTQSIENSSLLQECTQLKSSVAGHLKENSSLQEQIDGLKRDVVDLQRGINAHELENASLSQTLEDQHRQFAVKIESLSTEKARLLAQVETLSREHSNTLDARSALQDTLKDVKESAAALQEQVASLTSTNESLKENERLHLHELETMKADLENKSSVAQEKQAECDLLQSTLESTAQKLSQVEEREQASVARIKALESELASLQAQIVSAEREFDQMKEQLDGRVAILSDQIQAQSQSHTEQKETILVGFHNEQALLSSQIVDLQQKLDTVTRDLDSKRHEAEMLTAQCNDLRSSLGSAEAAQADLEDALARAREGSESQVQGLIQEVTHLKQVSEQQQLAHSGALTQEQERCRALSIDVDSLKQQLTEASTNATEARTTLVETQRALIGLLPSLNMSFDPQGLSLSDIVQHVSDKLRVHVESLRTEIHELSDTLSQRMEELSLTKQSLIQSRHEWSQVTEERDAARRERELVAMDRDSMAQSRHLEITRLTETCDMTAEEARQRMIQNRSLSRACGFLDSKLKKEKSKSAALIHAMREKLKLIEEDNEQQVQDAAVLRGRLSEMTQKIDDLERKCVRAESDRATANQHLGVARDKIDKLEHVLFTLSSKQPESAAIEGLLTIAEVIKHKLMARAFARLKPARPVRRRPLGSVDPNSLNSTSEDRSREKRQHKKLLNMAASPHISRLRQRRYEVTDEIMAAAIEGNDESLRSVLQTSGISSLVPLQAAMLKGSEPSKFLPLHRAISGFHFHANQQLLLDVLRTLIKCEADVKAVDHCGNTALHKAIQVCTAPAVVPVVRFLLRSGVDVNAQNGDKDTALHTELHRVRKLSTKVIEMLCSFGADVNRVNMSGVSPLTAALRCGLKRGIEKSGEFAGSLSGRSFWVAAVELLLQRGAQWDLEFRDVEGRSQLMLLMSGPAPPPNDHQTVSSFIEGALSAGFNLEDTDGDGRSGLEYLREFRLISTQLDSSFSTDASDRSLERSAAVVAEH